MVLTGRSLHCQVEHHVRIKFVTPILQILKFMIFFCIYITIYSIIYIFEIFSHLRFFNKFFSSIMRHSS